MSAISTFRQSADAIELSFKRAEQCKKLVIVYVVDVNLARYFIGTEAISSLEIKKTCEAELLLEHEKKGKQICELRLRDVKHFKGVIDVGITEGLKKETEGVI